MSCAHWHGLTAKSANASAQIPLTARRSRRRRSTRPHTGRDRRRRSRRTGRCAARRALPSAPGAAGHPQVQRVRKPPDTQHHLGGQRLLETETSPRRAPADRANRPGDTPQRRPLRRINVLLTGDSAMCSTEVAGVEPERHKEDQRRAAASSACASTSNPRSPHDRRRYVCHALVDDAEGTFRARRSGR